MTAIKVNFRASSGYVTDGAGATYCLATDTYPTTRGGVTFGWESGDVLLNQDRDRDNAVDPRLAGIHFQGNSGTQSVWRLDVTAAQHTIRLALGDAAAAQGYQYVQLTDTGSVIATIDKSAGTGSAEWYDAAGTLQAGSATWVSSNAGITHTFATTILRLRLGATSSQLGSSTIAHIELVAAAGGSIAAISGFQSMMRSNN